MAHETLYVDPPFLRIAADKVADIGDKIANDFTKLERAIEGPAPSTSWAVARAAKTLGKLWKTHLDRQGSTVRSHGGLLTKLADAYEECDAEAAKALGVALPEGGPVVKDRPGRPPA